jgi:hypothetical protein
VLPLPLPLLLLLLLLPTSMPLIFEGAEFN